MPRRYLPGYYQILVLLAIFLVVSISRWTYVSKYAVPLPFWDQWDAEGDFLLMSLIRKTFRVTDLWNSHNEHRIFPTRILSIILFKITGAWNNLTAARVNIFLAASIPVALIAILLKTKQLVGLRWLIVPVILIQFALPFSYENLLVGFQSQFYFLIFFTLLAAALTAYKPLGIKTYLTIFLLSAICVLTMASGILTPFIVAVIILLRLWMNRSSNVTHYLVACPFIALTIIGYLTIPNLDNNTGLKAESISDFINADLYILSWPFVGSQSAFVLLWGFGLVGIITGIFRRDLTSADLMMTGLFLWSLAQTAILAYGRGHDLTIVSSRYTELLTLGLVANAWFAVRLFEQSRFLIAKPVFLIFFIAFFKGHYLRRDTDRADIRNVYQHSLTQTMNVTSYLATRDSTFLYGKKHGQIPYPDPARLKHLLDNEKLVNILPESIKRYRNKKERQ